MPLLPLFPLGTVLFPGAELPLQLFEPRYLALAADLMGQPAGQRRFGVIAIRRGWEVGDGGARALYATGCEATAGPMTSDETSGPPVVRFVATGVRRFLLVGQPDTSTTPYARAEVRWLDDEITVEAVEAADRLRSAHAAYLAALDISPHPRNVPVAHLAGRATTLSRLSLEERQRALDAPDLTRCLERLTGCFRAEITVATAFPSVPLVLDPSQVSPN